MESVHRSLGNLRAVLCRIAPRRRWKGSSPPGAIADGGGFATVRGWAGPSERGIVIHSIVSPTEAQNTPLLDRVRKYAEDEMLTLRVAAIIPASHAASAHSRLEAGGVRGRLVLDFQSRLVGA